MPKYYEGEAVVKAFTETTNQSATWARGVLARMKEADVAPVVHAHWQQGISGMYAGKCACSECTRTIKGKLEDIKADCKFCPYCGARMDEEVKEDGTL